MKRILFATLLGCTMILASCATFKSSENDPKVFNAPPTTEKAEFIPHTESKPMKSYLAMNLPYPPYEALLKQIEKAEGLTLQSRGEAHITIITPVEYDNILKSHLSIEEINTIAEAVKIQDFPYTPVCIGKGEKEIKGKLEKTYFVVMESPALIDLRGAVETAFVKKGGKPQAFVPERFFPHVTLGFTSRDLHFEDGVVKNKSSCLYYFK